MRGDAYVVVNRGAAGTEGKGRAPQAQIGRGGRPTGVVCVGGGGGVFLPSSHATSKVIARALHEAEPRIQIPIANTFASCSNSNHTLFCQVDNEFFHHSFFYFCLMFVVFFYLIN